MAVDFIIAPEVEQDLAEAYACYEARRTGLGEEFLSCVDAGIAAICRMLEMYAAIHEQYAGGLYAASRMRSSTSIRQAW
jgi:hypothetical protein